MTIDVLATRPAGAPEPGYFKLRMIRGGPWVRAEIRHGGPDDRSPMWETWIGGKLIATPSPEPVRAGVFRVWYSGRPISEAEFRHMAGDQEWCEKYAPSSPEANPHEKIDVGKIDPQHFMPRGK